jgi:hypothetical protein
VIASSTGTDATLTLVTSTDAGLAPASGGGTTNFLRADGTFAAPPGGSPGGTNTQIQFNDSSAFGGDADLVWNKTTNVLGITGDVNLSDGGTYTTTLQTITPTADRTISLPNATGTVALVAGSSGQLLWNNAGVNAGASTLTYDGSILTTSGRFINSYNATASSPAKAFTGTWFTSTGTATTTKPHLLIEPTGTTSTGWSVNGTGLGVNAASGFTGNLLDLQVNGTSQARITSAGSVIAADGSKTVPSFRGADADTGIYFSGNNIRFTSDGENRLSLDSLCNLNLGSQTSLRWTSNGTDPNISPDIGLIRSAAGVVKVTNGSSGDGTISAQHRLVGTAPATASSTGTAGDVRYDTDYVYICTATNTWKRAALTTW